MELKHKLIAAAAAVLLVAAAAGWLVSHVRLLRLERSAGEQIEAAERQAARADELEKQTYVYKEKIEHLERRLTEIRRDYGVTQVLTYGDWQIDLPVAARDPAYVLWDIPD